MTIERIKKARKARRCDWCNECIDAGQPYSRYRCFEVTPKHDSEEAGSNEQAGSVDG